jgi:redox-sensitive bicupin YhaK (pirin superfamily)
MITLRKSADRGHVDHDWLRSYHTFSFASYFDPQHMKYRALRVINEDWIKAGKGFETHPHENMEILTYIIRGQLEHKDSMGNGSVIHAGELQRMTAGTGLTHSELNSSNEDTHLLQIWITPERGGLTPGYEQRDFSPRKKPNVLTLVASQTGRNDSLTIHQDLSLYAGLLDSGKSLQYATEHDRHIWIQVIKGIVDVNGELLHPGDGAAIDHENEFIISAEQPSEFLLFDLA